MIRHGLVGLDESCVGLVILTGESEPPLSPSVESGESGMTRMSGGGLNFELDVEFDGEDVVLSSFDFDKVVK